jgi:protein gp37
VGEKTAISWCDHTFNPWWGCVEVSPACDHCYARELAARFQPGLWGKDAERHIQGDGYWDQPFKWNRKAERAGVRARVFCGSMCDVAERRPDLDAPRERLRGLIDRTPWLDWLLLSKRPQDFGLVLPAGNVRQNIWLLTTVESQEYAWRIDELLKHPAVVHGISYEPALGLLQLDLPPKRFNESGGIDWVIAGGESGRKARPSHPGWFRSVRDQCQAAGVAFFFKQRGEFSWDGVDVGTEEESEPSLYVNLDGSSGSGWVLATDPEVVSNYCGDPPGATSVWLRRIGKKAAGTVLDGREWREFPNAHP